jgi:hypothetical protein
VNFVVEFVIGHVVVPIKHLLPHMSQKSSHTLTTMRLINLKYEGAPRVLVVAFEELRPVFSPSYVIWRCSFSNKFDGPPH